MSSGCRIVLRGLFDNPLDICRVVPEVSRTSWSRMLVQVFEDLEDNTQIVELTSHGHKDTDDMTDNLASNVS